MQHQQQKQTYPSNLSLDTIVIRETTREANAMEKARKGNFTLLIDYLREKNHDGLYVDRDGNLKMEFPWLLDLMLNLVSTTSTSTIKIIGKEQRQQIDELKGLVLDFYMNDRCQTLNGETTGYKYPRATADLYNYRENLTEKCGFFAEFIIALANEAVEFYNQNKKGEGKNLALDLFLEFAAENMANPRGRGLEGDGKSILIFNNVPHEYWKACAKLMLIAQMEGRVYKHAGVDRSAAYVLRECFSQDETSPEIDNVLGKAEKDTGIYREKNGFGLVSRVVFVVGCIFGIGFPLFAFYNDWFSRNWYNFPAEEPTPGVKNPKLSGETTTMPLLSQPPAERSSSPDLAPVVVQGQTPPPASDKDQGQTLAPAQVTTQLLSPQPPQLPPQHKSLGLVDNY